jgi:hypothetical protein
MKLAALPSAMLPPQISAGGDLFSLSPNRVHLSAVTGRR